MINATAHTHKFYRFVTSEKIVFLFIVFLAALLSQLLVSENYMILFLVAGTLVGLFLFGKPVYCFWVLFYSVFLMGGVISHFPEVTTLRWGVVLLSLMLGARTLLEFVVPDKNQGRPKLDRLLVLFLVFVFIGVVSSHINRISIVNLLVALKNYFQFIPVTFALAILPHLKKQSMPKKIISGLLIVAIIQVPVALYQRFIMSEQTIAMGFGVNDSICGTFSTALSSGASKALSLYLLFISGIMLSLAKHKNLSWRKAIFTSFIILVPIVFNETKVSFVYIPAVLVVLFRKEILKMRLKGIISLVLGAIVVLALVFAYKTVYTTSDQEFEGYIKQSLEYNFGERGYGRYSLNRLTVLRFWLEERKNFDLATLIIGHGLDAANEADGGFFAEKGHMAARYPLYGIGLTMVSKLLWETGVAGLVCFFAVLVAAFKRLSRVLENNGNQTTAFQRSILLGLQAGVALCIIETFVSSAFRNQEVYNFLVSSILGLALMMTQAPFKQEI